MDLGHLNSAEASQHKVVQIETSFPPGTDESLPAARMDWVVQILTCREPLPLRINSAQKQDGHLVHDGSHSPQRQNCQD